MLSGRVKSPKRRLDHWQRRFEREGLTAPLRLELRELLAPRVSLGEPSRWSREETSPEQATQISQLVGWKLVLAADDVRSILPRWTDARWISAKPLLLEEFQQLLLDALDLLCELDGADDRSDPSYMELPSITPHPQNQERLDWVSLIELLRDAWLAVRENNRARATRTAQNWFELPYPTFKRLALFAASQDGCIPPETWVDWLLADDAWWLWSVDTKREVCRLFVLQGQHLAEATQQRLEAAILAGPPREMYRGGLKEDEWQDLVWLRLAKLIISGCKLGVAAAARLDEISTDNPKWELASNESDEFPFYIGPVTAYTDRDEDTSDVERPPRKRRELMQWLMQLTPEGKDFYKSRWWRDICRTGLSCSLPALYDLSKDGKWPARRWGEALETWSTEKGTVSRSWRYAAPLVLAMPDDEFKDIADAVTWWMQAASQSINRHEGILLELCQRMLALPLEDVNTSDNPVTSTINWSWFNNLVSKHIRASSPIIRRIRRVTQALINLWLKQKPNDNDLLPDHLKPMFTALCDAQVGRFRHGRVLLGAYLITFFRVDPSWTEQHLLPFFDWSNPVEAKAVWEGFLRSPRLHQPLLIAFKPQFLDTASHYVELGGHCEQFAAFLTYAALTGVDGYSLETDFHLAFSKLPIGGLEKSAHSFYQALANVAEDQREAYWQNRV